jgi:GNAT superfamily N-acetyltransferase
MASASASFTIAAAAPSDVPLILSLVRELADFERLSHEVAATERQLHDALFGELPVAHAIVARTRDGASAGFALYFFSFSTFLARPGLYLEDLFVRAEFRNRGLGRLLLAHLAKIAVDRECGRMEWSVLNWNETALRVYRRIGAKPMDEWTVQRLTGQALAALAATAAAPER